MKQQILLVSHCFLNDAAKLKHQNTNEQALEHAQKRAFLNQMLEQNVELIQLPCPEFILYGANRWGHAVSQFNTPFFKNESRKMLEPVLLQLQEYAVHPERYEILGIVGIDGSPSCGIHVTYDGNWGGELSSHPDLEHTIQKIHQVNKPGVFMSVFQKMLIEYQLEIPFYSLESFLAGTTSSQYPSGSVMK